MAPLQDGVLRLPSKLLAIPLELRPLINNNLITDLN